MVLRWVVKVKGDGNIGRVMRRLMGRGEKMKLPVTGKRVTEYLGDTGVKKIREGKGEWCVEAVIRRTREVKGKGKGG